jgi:hypothetical protein
MIDYPPSTIAYNGVRNCDDYFVADVDEEDDDDVVFRFEDVHEHRPEFEQYCLQLKQEQDNEERNVRTDDLLATSVDKSNSIPIRLPHHHPNGNCNMVSPEDQYTTDVDLFEVERAKRKEYEMFYLISSSRKKQAMEDCATIPMYDMLGLGTKQLDQDRRQFTNGNLQEKGTMRLPTYPSLGHQPLWYVASLPFPPPPPSQPAMVPFLNLSTTMEDASSTVNSPTSTGTKARLERILHYTNQATMWCDDIGIGMMKSPGGNNDEGIFELDM